MSRCLTNEEKIDGLLIRKFENLRINKLGLTVSNQKYALIKSVTQSLFPLFNFFKVKEISSSSAETDEALQYLSIALSELGIIENYSRRPMKIEEDLGKRIIETIDGDTGKTIGITAEHFDTLDIIPDAITFYMMAALKDKLPSCRKVEDYYDSEAMSYLAKHVAASIIDEIRHSVNLTQYSMANSLNNIRYYMSCLEDGDNLKEDRTGVVRALMRYNAKEISSELKGILAFDVYEKDPGRVLGMMRKTVMDRKTTADAMFDKLGVHTDSEEAPIVLEKSIRRVSILQALK